MTRWKRGLAIVLSTCMIGGMMPLPVSAEGAVSGNEVQTENSSGETSTQESTTEQDGNAGEQEDTVTGQDDTNAQPGTEEQPSETEEQQETTEETAETVTGTEAIAAIQELIDALPEADSITEETLEDVTAQLDAIDEAKTALSDEELSQLDLTRYDAAIEKVMALMGVDGTGVAMLADMNTSPQYYTMQPGSTLDVTTVPMGELTPRVYQLNQNGATYTITGNRATTSSTTLRFVISADCTVILKDTEFTAGITYDDGTKTGYQGGTHGVFEVEPAKTAVFQLEGYNYIYPKVYYNGISKSCLPGILLKEDARVEFCGSGTLEIDGTIGKKIEIGNGNPGMYGGPGIVIMKSGNVSIDGFGSTYNLKNYNTPKGTVRFTYEGGNFRNTYDFQDQYEYMHTAPNGKSTMYRVEIPTGGSAKGKIKVGSTGTFSEFKAWSNGVLYAWQNGSNTTDYYVVDNGKYYHYQTGTYGSGSYTAAASKVTEKTAIGGFSGTVTLQGQSVSNVDMTFVREDTDGMTVSSTCTTDANGAYYIALPPGTYTVKLKFPEGEGTYWKKLTLSEEKEKGSQDINVAAVHGIVTDNAGNSLSNVSVTVTQGDKTYSTKTDSNGRYIIIPDGFSDGAVQAKAVVLSVDPVSTSLTWSNEKGVEWNVSIDTSQLASTVYVYTEDDLVMLANAADQLNNKTIEIMSDISLSGKFTGIPLGKTMLTLHGNNHTISNITWPLFTGGYFSDETYLKGTVSDLHLSGKLSNLNQLNDKTVPSAGALASITYRCNISNCSFEGTITGKGKIGGLVGYSKESTFKNCSVVLESASITNGKAFGGICGLFMDSEIYNSYTIVKQLSYAVITEYADYGTAAGGIAGDVNQSGAGKIINSYAIVDGQSGSKPFPVLGYALHWKDNLSKITYTNNYTCGGTAVFRTLDSVTQATDVSKDVVGAASGNSVNGQKALVDCLNEYVSANSKQGYKKWELGSDGYPVFLSLDAVSAKDVSVTYDGEPHSIEVTGAPDDAAITYSTDSSAAKTYSAVNPQITDVADSKTVYYRVSCNGETVDGSAAVTISKKNLTVQAGNQTITYGDTVPSYTATYAGLVARDNTTAFKNSLKYICTYQQGSNKGSYNIIPSGLSEANYNITYQKGTLTVGVKTIGIIWDDTLTFDYDGNKHLPTATATGMVGNDTLELTVSTVNGNATDAGTYTAKVTALTGDKAGNYILPTTVIKEYKINPVSLSAANITFTSTDTMIYTGKEQKPGITVKLGEKTLIENTDYTVSYANNINATTDTSKAKVTITGKGNYKGTVSKNFDIQKKALTVTADNKTIKYGEEPQFTATYNGFVNGETTTTNGVLTGILAFACDYVKAESNVGTYTITPKGLASTNYDISFVNGTLTVEQATGQVTIDAIGEKIFGDADFALTVDKHGSNGALTYTSSNESVLKVDNTGKVTLKKAGTATITVSMAADTNHTAASKSIDITVARKAATLQVTKASIEATYGDSDIDLGITKEGESTVTYATSDNNVATAADGKLHIVGAGDATITLSMEQSTNYLAANATISVKVNPAALTVTADNKSTDYGTDAPAFTVKYDGFKNGDTADKAGVLTGTLDFDCNYQKGDATNGKVGIYDITPKGLSAKNYTITFVKGILTVEKVTSSVSIGAVEEKTYGDTAFDLAVTRFGSTAVPTYASSNTSVLTVDETGKVTIKGAGTATVTVTLPQDDNYNQATDNVSITVNKKELTVTAEDKSITYGDAAPVYTAKYSGFVNGESENTADIFDGTLTFACNYVKAGSMGAGASGDGNADAGTTVNSKAGIYTITPSGLSSRNYNIEYVPGTLNVGKASGTVTITAVGNKTYGDEAFTLSVDKHGSDGALSCTSSDESVLTVDNTGMVTLKKTGTATITVLMAEGTNYKAAENALTVTVDQKVAKLEVTSLTYTVAYGDADIDLGLTTEGENPVTYTSTDNKVATAADGKLHIVGTGDAAINLSVAESTNYLAKDVTIIVKVNPAPLKITAEDKTIEYGSDTPAFTVTYDGFKNGEEADTDGVLVGTLDFDCNYQNGDAANGKAGNYDITPKGLTAKNYAITFVKGTLSVKEKAQEPSNDSGNNNNTGTNGGSAAGTEDSSSTGQNSNSSGKNNIGNSKNNSSKNTGSKNTGSQNNADTETKPYIKNDSGMEGWDVISSLLEETKSGDTVTVAMNGTTVVPSEIFDSIKGEDITLVLDMEDGISWKINGQDITASSGDIDFGVTIGADAGKSIPIDVINNVTDERYSMNLTLAYDGEFGFTATLTVNMESKNAGLYANLFYYNEQTGNLEFVSAGQIDSDGNVELEFTHASDYTIVIDAAVMDGRDEETVTSTENTETEGSAEAAENSEVVESTEAMESSETVESTEAVESSETVESTEAVENSEMVESSETVENSEMVESSETVDSTETAESSEEVENTEAEGDKTIPAVNEEDAKSDTWNPTILIIIGICILLIAFGAVIYVRKKSGSEEE